MDKEIDLVCDHLKAFTEEGGIFQVDPCDLRHVFDGFNRGCLEKRAVFREESFAFFEILCVKTA